MTFVIWLPCSVTRTCTVPTVVERVAVERAGRARTVVAAWSRRAACSVRVGFVAGLRSARWPAWCRTSAARSRPGSSASATARSPTWSTVPGDDLNDSERDEAERGGDDGGDGTSHDRSRFMVDFLQLEAFEVDLVTGHAEQREPPLQRVDESRAVRTRSSRGSRCRARRAATAGRRGGRCCRRRSRSRDHVDAHVRRVRRSVRSSSAKTASSGVATR